MEPSCPCCQNNLPGEDCQIHRDYRSEKNSPGHPFPAKLKMLDVGCGDWEKEINNYYLGCDDESEDQWVSEEEDTLLQNQDSIASPIIINFCDTSDGNPGVILIKSDSSECTNNKVGSLGSKNNSPELTEIESISSKGDKLVIVVEDENIIKEVGHDIVVDVSQPDISLNGKGCENKVETSPLQKCAPTIPFFVESFDYQHKPGKLDIIYLYDLYAKRLYMSPKQTPVKQNYRLRVKTSKKRRRLRSKSRYVYIHSKRYTNSNHTLRGGVPRSVTGCKTRYKRNRDGRNKANRSLAFQFKIKALYSDANSTDKTDDILPLDSKSDHKCPECDYSSNMNQVIHHYREMHFNLTCPKCDNSFAEPHFLQHCKNCKAPKPKLQCPNCELTCTESSLLSLAIHIKFSHPIKKCVVCDEHFVPQKFIEHARTCFFGPKQECTCPFCEKELAYTQLGDHIFTHPIAECPLCYKDISFDEAEEHIESCYLEKVNDSEESFGTVFSCPKCTLRFTFENMPAHIIKKHLSLNCVFCYTVMSRDEMREHIVACCQKHQNESY